MTDRYAVIGNPVAHSLSPAIHAEFARQTGQDISYVRLHAGLGDFAATVRQFQAGGGKGLNVTVPFKREACELARRVSARAQRAGAVNTLVFADDIAGDNTDGVGLLRDLQTNLGFAIGGRRVLILGAGGAARGILAPLLEAGPAQVSIANRTFETAKKLCGEFSPELTGAGNTTSYSSQSGLTAHPLEALPAEGFDLIINATSSSLAGADLGLIETVFAPDALAYDLMYGKGLTPFLGFAQHHGARVADGLGMLVEQAAESFFIWRGVRPETQSVIAAIGGRAQIGTGSGRS